MENKGQNFIEQIISKDISSGLDKEAFALDFRQNPTDTCILDSKAIGLNFGLDAI
ncbi:MAG: hypothetical protein CM15mP121_1030 [Bacteroidota bacterium]|nr:MAG: hypothetical protein CM15mP121_1030 [Bacteroidota bacterium]